jgi:hypothetical protein
MLKSQFDSNLDGTDMPRDLTEKRLITWKRTTIFLTCMIPEVLLKRFISNEKVRRAWREKVSQDTL